MTQQVVTTNRDAAKRSFEIKDKRGHVLFRVENGVLVLRARRCGVTEYHRFTLREVKDWLERS